MGACSVGHYELLRRVEFYVNRHVGAPSSSGDSQTASGTGSGDASLLGVSVHTLRSWRQRNRGPNFLKLGKRVLYRKSAITRFLDDNEHTTLDSGAVTDFQNRRV